MSDERMRILPDIMISKFGNSGYGYWKLIGSYQEPITDRLLVRDKIRS